jgi:hypothetical protein
MTLQMLQTKIPRGGRQTGSYPETEFGEIRGNVPEPDAWPGITSG